LDIERNIMLFGFLFGPYFFLSIEYRAFVHAQQGVVVIGDVLPPDAVACGREQKVDGQGPRGKERLVKCRF
jgi:hypothetical protein